MYCNPKIHQGLVLRNFELSFWENSGLSTGTLAKSTRKGILTTESVGKYFFLLLVESKALLAVSSERLILHCQD